MYKKRRLIFSCIIFLSLTACSSANDSNNRIKRAYSTKSSTEESHTVITETESKGYRNSANLGSSHENAQAPPEKKRAQNIAAEISVIDGVGGANVVITGNTAIVGITLEVEISESSFISLKREIEKQVKAFDNEIDHVAVTASPHLVERILKMQEGQKEKNSELTYEGRHIKKGETI